MTSRPTTAGTPVEPPKPALTGDARKRRAQRRRRGIAVVAAATISAWPLAWSLAANSPAQTSPGTFNGWAFDACQAPAASTMDAWMSDPSNPYRGIGIYISGSLRACSQPNLTSAWVNHVQQAGWHLLPLTVGPQASCTGFSQVINDAPANTYSAARQQGAAQADSAVANARILGINPGSTLFYDMENWHTGYNDCDASTLWFMSAWSNRLHAAGYAGGVYVSGSSGARLLNSMANNKPSGFVLPDQIWVAEWNNQENVNSSYIDPGNWPKHQRVHQYYGGHNATNGGITLNIDSNFADAAPVNPIPAAVPDSAIGALPPVTTPTPPVTTPTATVTPTPAAPVTTTPATTAPATPAKVLPPSKVPPVVTPSTPKTSSTPVVTAPPATPTKPVTPTPAVMAPSAPPPAKLSTPTTTPPAPKPTAPVTTATTPVTQPVTHPVTQPVAVPVAAPVNKADKLGTAAGIQPPVHAAVAVLQPKQADTVPIMVTRTRTVATLPSSPPSTARALAQPSPSTTAPTTPASPTTSANADVQAAPLQPTLPLSAPSASAQPSMMTQLWHGTQNALAAIGSALAAGAGFLGRGFGSMLGW